MVLGMSLSTYTTLHVILSLIGIGSGFIVLFGLINGRLLSPWNVVFLVTTILTSLTGFGFPNDKVTPGIILGIRMGVAVAIVGALLAETKAAQAGLGYLVFNAYRNLNMSRMYALLLLVFALAAAINWLMSMLSARSVATRERSNVSGFLV